MVVGKDGSKEHTESRASSLSVRMRVSLFIYLYAK